MNEFGEIFEKKIVEFELRKPKLYAPVDLRLFVGSGVFANQKLGVAFKDGLRMNVTGIYSLN